MEKIVFFINIERGKRRKENVDNSYMKEFFFFINIERKILFNNIEKDKRIELIKCIIFLSFFVSSD